MEKKHTYLPIVEGGPRRDRIDSRLSSTHKQLRTNVTLNGKSTYIPKRDDGKRILQGTLYADVAECPDCKKILRKKYFENHAIRKNIRKNNGLNLYCRDCQSVHYTKKSGYKLGDGGDNFIADDDEEPGYYKKSAEEKAEEKAEFEDDGDTDDEEESIQNKLIESSLHDNDEEEGEEEDEEEGEEEDEEEGEEEDEEGEEFHVEDIICHKYIKRSRKILFAVKWLGYEDEKNTFEPAESLCHLDVFQRYICITPELYNLHSKEFCRPL